MVKKHLRKETEILAVNLVLASVHLKNGYGTVTVNLVSWRMSHFALELLTTERFELFLVYKLEFAYLMSMSIEFALHVLEAKFAYPQTAIGNSHVFLGKRCVKPSLDIKLAEPNVPYS